jgi:HTH-type transcriptional regulator, sugar sensing transcriptional regulator
LEPRKLRAKLILKDLDKIGLNGYEAKSYLSLLERTNLTAAEVARIAGIPRAKVYEILESLTSRGYCQTIPGKVRRYSAMNPSALKDIFIEEERDRLETQLEKLRSEMKLKEAELAQSIKTADVLVDLLSPLYEKGRTETDPLDYIEIIKEPLQLQKRIIQLINSAQQEILVFSEPPTLISRQKILEQIEHEKESLQKGVISKCIYQYPDTGEQQRWMLEYIALAQEAGEQARAIPQIPIRMMIFDERVVVFILEDPILHKPSRTTQIIEHRSLARSLKILFETIWNRADDLETLKKRASEDNIGNDGLDK